MSKSESSNLVDDWQREALDIRWLWWFKGGQEEGVKPEGRKKERGRRKEELGKRTKWEKEGTILS